MLSGQNILHISLNDPVQKVCLWYEEVIRNIIGRENIGRINQLWEEILPFRLIMTFRAEDFTVKKLEERISDLTEQGIFMPQVILIDGLAFNDDVRQCMIDLKKLAQNYALRVWFTVRTHRHEPLGPEGIPKQLLPVNDLMDVAIQLVPEKKEIRVELLKGGVDAESPPNLILDPSSLLVQDKT